MPDTPPDTPPDPVPDLEAGSLPEPAGAASPAAPGPAELAGSRRRLDDAVRTVLGPDALLRPEQAEALGWLAERDVLLVARTGAGKTAVYAIATLLTGRSAVVVSPLLALQRDQVAALRDGGLRAAAASSASGGHRRTLDAFAAGELDVLLLAPEQLARRDVVDAVEAGRPGLLVVDEAHCVSEWGHDFRPDYRHLAGIVERLGNLRVLALTATASPQVRTEIVDGLGMARPAVVVHDADRPGIWLGVHHAATERQRDDRVVAEVLEEGTSGAVIVYARTRAHVDALADALEAAGRRPLRYHAGLPARQRSDVERAFLDGREDLVVATSAFGMGMDRPDVRLVVHAGAPTSLEEYWQEVGRAGRDEEPARAVLVARSEDIGLNRYLRGSGAPRRATLEAVLAAVRDGGGDRAEITRRSGLSSRTAARSLAELVDVGAVVRDGDRFARAGTGAADAVRAVRQRHEHRATLERSRVELVRAYADTTDCRRRVLLELLGEQHPQVCGRCDSCDAGTSVDVTASPLHVGQAVRHEAWGPGVVAVVEPDRVTVLFEQRGYVALDTAVALDSGVLGAADDVLEEAG